MTVPQRTEVSTVLRFVERTVSRGVPVRIAITRAARRYRMDAGLIRAFYRNSN